MKKNIKLILSAIVVLAVIAAAALYLLKNDGKNNGPQTQNSLGQHDCLAKFRVESNAKNADGSKILETDFFQSFASGSFFGKIKDYQPGLNKQFSALTNQLMQEKKVKTYAHLWADVCLYREDLLNPENGATLYYYVEHYYCSNNCKTGKYDIRVDLDADGNFTGYRQGDIF